MKKKKTKKKTFESKFTDNALKKVLPIRYEIFLLFYASQNLASDLEKEKENYVVWMVQ